MRKNGIDKRIHEIDGGVCAPSGFSATGVFCGIELADPETCATQKEDLAIIACEKRVPTACVFSDGGIVCPSVAVTQKHLKSNGGRAQAILLNGGIANYLENGSNIIENFCRDLERKAGISRDESVVISVGEIGKHFPQTVYLQGVELLVKGWGSTNSASQKVARAIAFGGQSQNQTAFSFRLGDTPCKIGAVYQKGLHNKNALSGLVCLLTTDACITPEMLQKALDGAVKDSFDMLCLDGANSPSDTVCIMASGNAGNYQISAEDTEYDKFRYFLTQVLQKISEKIATNTAKTGVFTCRVEGAKSKRVARETAKALAFSNAIKSGLRKGIINADEAVCILHGVGEGVAFGQITLSVKSEKGEAVLFEDSKRAGICESALKRILSANRMEICLKIGRGNYSATAMGTL